MMWEYGWNEYRQIKNPHKTKCGFMGIKVML